MHPWSVLCSFIGFKDAFLCGGHHMEINGEVKYLYPYGMPEETLLSN